MANRASITRMINASQNLPRYAAINPRTAPAIRERATAPATTCSVTREPKMMRLAMSRPSSSVPSQWVVLGGLSIFSTATCCGSKGDNSGAKAAINTRPRKRSVPTAPCRCLSRSRIRRGSAPPPRADVLSGEPVAMLGGGVSCTWFTTLGLPLHDQELPDSRIDVRVQYVGDQVDEYDQQDDQEDAALNHREIPRGHCGDDEAPQSRR